MRIGFNPNKDKIITASECFHQVIVPVYIPNQEGYFKDSLPILRNCLESLSKTSHSKTFLTVVNNGSCSEVKEYLDDLYSKELIQELIHTANIGKLNAILKGLTGHPFELVTIADADVLFLNNWQKASYAVFEAFPKTGSVSTTPNSKMARYFTSNVIFDSFFSKRLKFTNVVNPRAMKMFAKSIGNEHLFNELHLKKILTIENDSTTAVVGSGHFVATYRGAVFKEVKTRYSQFSLGGASEGELLDKRVTDLGFWRLSTQDNYTFHMGNTHEAWMSEQIRQLSDVQNDIAVPQLKKVNDTRFSSWIKQSVFSRIIFRKPFWEMFLRYKGLTKQQTKIY